jgi:hypothetical protein
MKPKNYKHTTMISLMCIMVMILCPSCVSSKKVENTRTSVCAAGNYCGIIAMQYVAEKLGKAATLKELQEMVHGNGRDVSFFQLKAIAEKLGLYACAVKVDLVTIGALDYEKILYLPETKHFVVVGHIDEKYVRLIDLSSNRFYYRDTIEHLNSMWQGQVLLVDNKSLYLASPIIELPYEETCKIIGGGCQKCDKKLQDAADFPCQEVSGECGGEHTVYYQRYGCGSASTSPCNETGMVGHKSEACVSDPNTQNCTGDGEWASSSIQACG